jgi:hypothetical protein
MTIRGITAAIIAALLLALAAPPALAASGQPFLETPGLTIDFVTNPLLMCHYYLRGYGEVSVKPAGSLDIDFNSEATAYGQAQRYIENPAVWRWIDETIAGIGDIAGLRKAAADLPAAYRSEEARSGVNLVVDALESGCPNYMKSVYPTELAGINRVLVGAKKRFLVGRDRIFGALAKQMAFEPIARPIRVFVVVRTGGVASWGATGEFYFTVIGSYGQSPLSLLETGIHEATHIADALQSFRSEAILGRVRQGTDGAVRGDVDAFLHGLVAFNAGELVKRFLSQSYTHVGVQAPGVIQTYKPYLSTYEYIWTAYMDGRMKPDAVVAKLIEEFNAVRKLQGGPTESAP